MKQGTCDLCGEWAGELIDGACHDCRNRLKLDDLGARPPLASPPPTPASAYTLTLTARVREVVADLYNDIPADAVIEHIICEALFLAGEDVRRGQSIELESLGQLSRCGAQIAFMPSDWLKGVAA